MAIDITIPDDLWDGPEQAVITAWLFDDGSAVTDGALIAEIMVEKVQYELRAPSAGTLAILRQQDEIVSKGDLVATIR